MREQCDRFIEEAAWFVPGYECNFPVAPGDFDGLISGCRLTQTALLGNPYASISARAGVGQRVGLCPSSQQALNVADAAIDFGARCVLYVCVFVAVMLGAVVVVELV